MTNDITVLGVLSLLDTDKQQRKVFAQHVADELMAGNADPLKIHLQVKCMEDIVDQVKKHPDYKSCVLDAAYQAGKKFEAYNAKFEVRSAAGRYDFSNDAEYSRLKEAIKQRETYLKGLPPEGVQRVTPDGEVVTDLPPVYTPGEDAVFVTLK